MENEKVSSGKLGESDKKEQQAYIFDFINNHPLGTVSTISLSGSPSSAVVYVMVKDDLTFYFSTRTNTEKYENILRNQNVALTIFDELTLETVQLSGIASVLINSKEISEVMQSLRRITSKEKPKWMGYLDKISHGVAHVDVSQWVPPIGQIGGGGSVFIKIEPLWVRYRRYDSDLKADKKYTEYLIEAT